MSSEPTIDASAATARAPDPPPLQAPTPVPDAPLASARPTLEAWCAQLAEIDTLGDALEQAIARDDVIAVVATMMQLRHARASVARIEVPEVVDPSTADHEIMDAVRTLLIRSHGVEQVMRRWLERPIPADPRLLASPLGIAVLADSILPITWDFASDLVVLVGAELSPLAHLLADVGQQRVIVMAPAPGAELDVPSTAVRVSSVAELSLAMRLYGMMAPEQVVVRSAISVDPALADACATTAREGLGDLRVHRNTVHAFSRTWLEQGIKNLPAIARWPSIDAVGDAFAGRPMVIVAPGPSLAHNVDQLRELAGRAVICAFSHSLKPVLAAGVVPDVIITVDPQDVRYHFAGCDLQDSYLLNAATIHPTLFELPARGVLTLSANCTIDDWMFNAYEERPVVPGGGSVATSAFSLALRWRCDPIIFLGLDLSFADGRYYVETSSDGDTRAQVDANGTVAVGGWSAGFTAMKATAGPAGVVERAIDLPGWHGGRVQSTFMFGLFHRWFVDRMATVTDRTVYNCTEGGAWIEGMDHRPFAEVRASLVAQVDARATLDDVVARLDRPGRATTMRRHLEGQLGRLRKARKLATRARAVIAAGGSDRELRRIERALTTTLAPVEFAALLAQRELGRASSTAAHAESDGTLLAASAALFATLIGVIDQLIPMLSAAHADVERPDAITR